MTAGASGVSSGAAAAGLRVTWLGHSTVVVDVVSVGGGRAARVLTDPLLHRHAGLLRRRGARPPEEAWRGSDVVLLSHLHHDHAELGSLRLLGDVPVLTAPANARWLRGRGVRGVALDDAWHALGADGRRPLVEVRLVPAVHGHRPMPHRPNATNGHLVRVRAGAGGTDRTTVWAVGDTERFAGMGGLAELAGGPVDVALVPVSGWGPRLSGGHLGPVEAARVCADVGVRVAIPVHWGTLHAPGGRHVPRGWMDRAGAAFAAAVRREAPGTRAVVLRPGESWTTS
ncbi:MBL fold metallo-hydrolase [Cellulosimicrobium arenosum]|uniref:MBL fold metallo-hydrolase n=1 Tax=Cellulosimicrobium arenosum TaxID=2708133 RepID=A0A927J063_9MICO|nr:MBL fold metallo-hydrolase [Cellulosimicrobium arenosum]MBD8079238.1 MBL fold metallo-hydrolase [Cellulosimicrobium arenosum]